MSSSELDEKLECRVLDFKGQNEFDLDERQRVMKEYLNILVRQDPSMQGEQLIQHLAKLPPLERYAEPPLTFARFPVHIPSLTAVLRHSRESLQSFFCPDDWNLHLSGREDAPDPRHFNDLLNALSSLSNLKEFRWHAITYVYVNETDNHSGFIRINVDQVFEAILRANSPLEVINLECDLGMASVWPGSAMSAAMLVKFLKAHASTLRNTSIFFPLCDGEYFQALANYFQESQCQLSRLSRLSLAFGEINEEGEALVKRLLGITLGNNGIASLRDLDIQVDTQSKQSILKQISLCAAACLKKNKNLLRFQLKKNENRNVRFSNGTLLSSDDVATAAKAFTETLQFNSTLELVQFHMTQTDPQDQAEPNESAEVKEMNKMLELNRLGRKDFLQHGNEVPKKDWIMGMEKSPNNLDWLYFLVRTNPTLCQLQNESSQAAAEEEEEEEEEEETFVVPKKKLKKSF